MSSILRITPTPLLGIPFSGLFGSLEARKPQTFARRAAGSTPGDDTVPQSQSVDMERLMRAARVAPELSLIEWDGDQPARAASSPQNVALIDPSTFDARRRKIRARYIAARFPDAVTPSGEWREAGEIVKTARLLFEEERTELALEMLELAIQELSGETPLWLAKLELHFLMRDGPGFVATAAAFHDRHPQSEAWDDVMRLGSALAPQEPLFGGNGANRDFEHYGPWPHLPNWIQAPWDLTAEVLAADFHASVRGLRNAA